MKEQKNNGTAFYVSNMGLSYADHANPLPLNKAVVESLLRWRYSRGAKSRGRLQLIAGIFCFWISILFLIGGIAAGLIIPSMIVILLLGGAGGALVHTGIKNKRNAEPNDMKIVNGCYYLKETYVTDHKLLGHPSDDDRTHAFTFADGEEILAAPGRNCDRTFEDYGKIGDRCFLLYFDEEKIPFFVFDAQWWALQPDLASFVRRRP